MVMKKALLVFLSVFFMAFLTAASWGATNEEGRLEKEASAIDKKAGEPQGEKAVVDRLEKEFKVDEARIKSLRDQKLGFGEISIVLAMAGKMPGGINDANVNRIMSMRQGPPKEGWGEIAKKLGFKLGPVISEVKKVESGKGIEKGEKGKEMKEEGKGKTEEHGEKPQRPEKPERGGRK